MSNATAGAGLVDQVLRRQRLVVAAGLVTLAALAWGYIVDMSRTMSPSAMGSASAMAMSTGSGGPGLLWLVPMWVVMMIAMMVPSAAPTILLFAGVARQRRTRGVASASVMAFTLGYLLVWTLYATIAAIAQWQLHNLALLSPSVGSATPFLGAALLILAGAYQWLPPKRACLSHCRSPLGFFSQHWREGTGGALRMGMEHGSHCVGCCWALMALLFVAGVMNLLWVVGIAAFVLVERLVPGGPLAGRVAGVGMLGWGIWMLTRG